VKAMLDACVLYPTVLREVLLAAAAAGFFKVLVSPRVLEEWALAAARRGPSDEALARGAIALFRARAAVEEVVPPEGLERRLWLPDASDIHVLAAAVAGGADVIVTLNASDFPRHVLAEEGIARADPDALLLGFFRSEPLRLRAAVEPVRAEAERLSGVRWEIRALMKKAGLPRLGKALAQPDA